MSGCYLSATHNLTFSVEQFWCKEATPSQRKSSRSHNSLNKGGFSGFQCELSLERLCTENPFQSVNSQLFIDTLMFEYVDITVD